MVKHTQIIRRLLPTGCLSVFDHFVGLALKGLSHLQSFCSGNFWRRVDLQNFFKCRCFWKFLFIKSWLVAFKHCCFRNIIVSRKFVLGKNKNFTKVPALKLSSFISLDISNTPITDKRKIDKPLIKRNDFFVTIVFVF